MQLPPMFGGKESVMDKLGCSGFANAANSPFFQDRINAARRTAPPRKVFMTDSQKIIFSIEHGYWPVAT